MSQRMDEIKRALYQLCAERKFYMISHPNGDLAIVTDEDEMSCVAEIGPEGIREPLDSSAAGEIHQQALSSYADFNAAFDRFCPANIPRPRCPEHDNTGKERVQ
jgi:hypothetical protein